MKLKLTTSALVLCTIAITGCMEPYAKTQQRAYVPAPVHSVPAPPVRSAPTTEKSVTRTTTGTKSTPVATTSPPRSVSTANKAQTRRHDDGIDVLKPVEASGVESAPITIHID
jgi:septal ring-binding cell division protein DamX